MITVDQEKLEAIALQIKMLLPNFDGNVQVNLSKSHDKPKVNVYLADVTRAKK